MAAHAPATGPLRAARAGLAAMLVATLLWGGTFVIIRDSLRALAPVTLVFLRFAIAAALLGTIAVARRARFDHHAWRGGLLGGVAAAGGYLFQAIGLESTSAGSSAFLTCTGTLFAAFLAWACLRQRPSQTLLLGIALALAGSALLPSAGRFRLGPGELWTLLGAVAFAFQIVALARYAARADIVALSFVQAATLALLLAPFARTSLAALAGTDAAARWRLVYLAIAGSTIAPMLQIVAQRTLSAGRVGLLFALEPVFALGFAIIGGGERFHGLWWLGAAMVLAGVLVVEVPAARDSARGRDALHHVEEGSLEHRQ